MKTTEPEGEWWIKLLLAIFVGVAFWVFAAAMLNALCAGCLF